MALLTDEVGERTEAPTSLRIDEARGAGRVARSGDLVAAAILLGAMGALWLSAPQMLKALTTMTATLLGPPEAGGVWDVVAPVIRSTVPFVLVLLAVGILVNLIQTGSLASVDPLKPNLKRIAPAAGLRRIFSRRSLMRGVLACAKILTVTLISLASIPPVVERIVTGAAGLGSAELLREAGLLAMRMGFRVGIALGLLGLVDLLYQRWEHRNDLKITRRELLDDLRRMEGGSRLRRRRAQTRRRTVSQGPSNPDRKQPKDQGNY